MACIGYRQTGNVDFGPLPGSFLFLHIFSNSLISNFPSKIFSLSEVVECGKYFKDFFDFDNEAYISKRKSKKIKARYILDSSEEAITLSKKNKEELRETKHLNELNEVKSDIWSYEDKLVLFTYVKDKPIGIEIRDIEVARIFQRIFSALWGLSK